MRHIYFSIFILLLTFLSSCDKNKNSAASYQEQKISLEEQERRNPLSFLSAGGTYRQTLLGIKIVINGTVTNSASIATYKDVRIRVRFYSKTKTEISSEIYVLYEFIPPGKTKDFTWRIETPGGTESVSWDIISALAK